MRRKYKRLLAMALCGVMVLSNLNVTALAGDTIRIEEEETEHIHTHDIQVISGEDVSEKDGTSLVDGDTVDAADDELYTGDASTDMGRSDESTPGNGDSGEDAGDKEAIPALQSEDENQDSENSDDEADSPDEEEEASDDGTSEAFAPKITIIRDERDADKFITDQQMSRPNTYCYEPTVTVNAESGTIKSITVNGEAIELAETVDSYTFKLEFDQYDDERLEIYATNSKGKRGLAIVNKHAVYVGESTSYRETVTQATCTRSGVERIVYDCNYCHTRYLENITVTYKALGHHFADEGTVETGCDGSYIKQTCVTCGFVQTTSMSSNGTGHTWGEIQVVAPVSKMDSYREGYSYRQCGSCGFVQLVDNSIQYPDDIEHKHTFNVWSDAQSATCTSPRYEARVCSKCNYKEWRNTGSTLGGHVWRDINWQIIKEPTCVEEGLRRRTCAHTGCNVTQEEMIPATGKHNYVSTVTKEPGCETEGIRTYKCSSCEDSYTEPIPAAKHTPKAENDGDCTSATVCAVCGQRLQESDKQHNFSGVYKRTTDGKGHTVTCVNPGCKVVSPVQAHFAGEDDGDCTTDVKCPCGYPVKAAKSNHATPSGGWTSNQWEKTPTQHILYCANAGCTKPVIVSDHLFTYVTSSSGHYQRCSICLYTTEQTAHTFVLKNDGTNHWSECADCGYKMNVARHIMQYTYNDAGHWKYCTDCGYVDETTRDGHRTATDDDHNCMTRVECDCGYILIPGSNGHDFQTDVWQHDKTQHWHNCINKDCQVRGAAAEHVAGEVIKTNEIPPTCTEDGSYDEHILCGVCGVEMSSRHVSVPKTEHTWVEEENTATCTRSGVRRDNCTTCGATRTTPSTKLDHSWGEWEKVDNICGSSEVLRRICQVCGEIQMDGINSSDHTWESVATVDQKATCTTEGRESIHCSRCDAVKQDSIKIIPANGHTYGMFSFVEGSADCTHDGIQTAKCYSCDAVITEPAPGTMLDHDWGDWETLSAATCTAGGSEVRYCKVCQTAETRSTLVAGHIYTDWVKEADPTCVLPGRDTRYCTGCGNLQIQYIKALGHDWENWVTEQEAGCTTDGLKSRVCSKCREHEEMTVKAAGHQWNVRFQWAKDYSVAEAFVTCKNDSGHMEYHVADVTKQTTAAACEQAGVNNYTATVTLFDNVTKYTDKRTQNLPALGHKWSSWKTKAATVFAGEQQTRTCSNCKKTETKKKGSKLKPTMKLPASSLKMKVQQKTTAFKVTGMANGDSLKSVKSSNTKVLKVSGVKSSGKLTLTAQKKTGKATLTFKLASGLTKKVKVTVQKNDVKTTKISGLPKKLTMKKGAKKTLKPVIAPVTSMQKVTYKSSNTKVATVSSKGVVKAKKAGKVKITVKSGSKKFVVKVTVKKK